MGCAASTSADRLRFKRAVLAGERDSKGRLKVQAGKLRLELNDQKLKALPALVGTQHVVRLSLASNSIHQLPDDMGAGGCWASLRELVLDRNTFVAVPAAVATLPALETLSIADNPIFLGEAFTVLARCKRLTSLNLRGIHLESIPKELFSPAVPLKRLCVRANASVDLSGLPKLQHLTDLDIAECEFREVPPD
eukprot:Rhum_TRINITY_DN23827_c0_g1::Rhum_TRINITY_DN23827_c0_g1_i1::g.178819::m.178819